MSTQILLALLDEGQEYHRLQAAAAKTAAARAGVPLEVVFAENNAVVQIHQLFKAIHAPEGERPLALVVHSVSGEGLERVGRNAIRAGIGWIVLNRRTAYLEELRALRKDLPIACVTPDQAEIGRIHAGQLLALAPGGGPVLYVQGPLDTSAAQDRLQATQAAVARVSFQWKVVNGDWSAESGERAVASWLRLKTAEASRPVVILAQNDAMATGARRAAVAHHPDWRNIPVVGCDGLPDSGQRLVATGELAATVLMPATAGAAIELLARWQQNRRPLSPEHVLRPEPYPADGPRGR